VTDPDPILDELRQQISENDRRLVDGLNTRLELVRRVKAHKESQGIDFIDPDRERQMFADLERANRGPLSSVGLHAFFAGLLELTKKEIS
jgi:chorismate mutase